MYAAVLVVTGLSVLLRTGALHGGYWIDEAIAVGIASHDLTAIPGLLLQDGSPPAYYLLLGVWLQLAGTGEAAARSLSLVFATVAVPVGFWAANAVGGRRAGIVAALVTAGCPFLAYYAQEARMYTLVAVLSLIASAAFVLAFMRGRRRHLVTLGAALVLLLYTHTWGVFLAAALAAAWIVLWRSGRVAGRDGALLAGAIGVAYAPWLPSLAFQTLHTGAPWAERPSLLWPAIAAIAVAAAAGRRRAPEPARVLALVVAVGIVAAWLVSQVEPAWSPRYLAVFYGPVVLALASRPRGAAVLPVVAAAGWLLLAAPAAKSNARAVAVSAGLALRPGDLVVCTQPEQVPVLHRYLPPGVRYLTPLGTPADPALTDWRDAVARMRAGRAARVLAPQLRRLPPGLRVVLVTPVPRRTGSTWSRIVRRRTREWRAVLRADPRLRPVGRTSRPDPARFRSTIRAEIFEVDQPSSTRASIVVAPRARATETR